MSNRVFPRKDDLTPEQKEPYYVLGLDPGIASCGFCLIDLNNHTIPEMGVHLFSAPQEDKTKVSLATGRRMARSSRRNNLRTKNRLKHCMNLLKEYGLVPENVDRTWFQSRKGDKPLLKLRVAGLDRLLTDRELAQVLYSLCSHRGYIPHGEGKVGDGASGETEDAEGKKVLGAISENSARLKAGGYRTVGEMLYHLGSSRNKGGEYVHCVLNSQIVTEATLLINAQRKFGSHALDDKFEPKYIECLTWQKQSLDHDEKVYGLVEMCSYFKDEKRAANADISSELCRAYERLGHLVMVHPDKTETYLTPEQRSRYLNILFSATPLKGNKDCKVRYSDIRKDLDLNSRISFKGISPDQESNEVFAPKAWRKMRGCISPELLARMYDDRDLGDSICEALAYASSEDSLINRLEDMDLDLSEDEVDQLLGIPFASKLFSGYGNRSLKALNLLLSCFEEGEVRTLKEAEEASGLLGYRLTDKHPRGKLLPAYSEYEQSCNNPVVLRALSRMRKIVNAIIKIYGVANEIHIELGRELKRSKKEKEAISKRQRENEKNNKRFAEVAASILKIDPDDVPGKVLRKLALREEQDEKDAYTGAPIDLVRLVTDDRYCEIDHILPYSRTCDDSRANKVLVLSSSNQNKRNRTPYEWMTSGEAGAPDWNEYCGRVYALVKDWRKRNNLLNTDLPHDLEGDFIARNLNDDRYMSRAVKNYLEDCLLFPEDGNKRHVYAVAGGATANLRWLWGLNLGENNTKDRSDDRHHSVDAAVIAACSASTIKKIADARSEGREKFHKHRKSRLAGTQPWPTFAAEVLARREFVVPARMVNYGVTGRAFEETLYHVDGFTEDKAKYALVRAGNKTKKMGNVHFVTEDSAYPVDGIAFLRLWLDQTARPNGKVKGKWYAEPVYYADIPSIRNGSYVPRACTIHVARTSWEPVPETALQSEPITLFSGDILVVDDRVARYCSIGISGCNLIVCNALTGEKTTQFPSFGSWGRDTKVSVLTEDCLGHCYSRMSIDPEGTSFSLRD